MDRRQIPNSAATMYDEKRTLEERTFPKENNRLLGKATQHLIFSQKKQ